MFEKLKTAIWVLSFCILHSAFCISASAAALSANRDTPELKPANLIWLTQGSNVIYAGSIVAVNSSGVAVPAADATGYDVVGRAEVYQDNTGSGYSSTKTINVRRGVFQWENGDSITDADIGSLVYVTDDQTVQKGASSYDIIAGVVVKYESTGVWVDTHDIGAQGAITPASMAVSGAATVGTTLGVTGNTTLKGTANIAGTLTATGAVTMIGSATVGSTLGVTGNSTLSGNLNVTGTHTNTGASRLLGALTVDGAVVLTNAVTLSAPAGVGTYTNAATGFTNVFDVGGRLVSHNP
jgi:hypothetical protein